MSGVGLFGAIVIGILAGWIAEKMLGRKHGIITNLLVGLFGAMLGAFLARMAGILYAGWWPSLLASAVGAIVLLLLLSIVKTPRLR